jgi:hypothetical protein
MRLQESESWPGHSAAVYEDALDQDVLQQLTAQSDALAAIEPNFWLPRSAVEAGAPAARTLVERAVQQLHDRLLHHMLPAGWTGAEWWCQVYDSPGRGLPFHFDKDELSMATDGSLRHPLLSCVIYLNSAAECGADEPLGATAVLEQRWVGGRAQPEPSRKAVVVWPRARRVLVFDGELSHGVLDWVPGGAVRRTLLINFWDGDAPGGTGRPDADAFVRAHGLPPLAPPTAAQPAPPSAATLIPLPLFTIAADAHCAGEPMPLLEALAAAAGGERRAEQAGAAAVAHADTVLWQLEVDEDESTPCVACLVPDACVQDD